MGFKSCSAQLNTKKACAPDLTNPCLGPPAASQDLPRQCSQARGSDGGRTIDIGVRALTLPSMFFALAPDKIDSWIRRSTTRPRPASGN
jgi:hypothetical protein